MPRNQKFYVSLADTSYDSASKTYTIGELINYNLENVSEVTVDEATVSLEEKQSFVYLCSSEIAIRKRHSPLTNSGVGNIISVFHCPQAQLERSDTVTTTTTETSVSSSDIAARSDIFMLLDFSDSSMVTLAAGVDSLTQIIATNDSTFTFVSSDAAGIPYEDFGTNSKKCINLNTGNIRLSDSSTVSEPESGTLCMLFSTQTTINDVQTLIDAYRWRILCNSDKLAYYTGSNVDTTISLTAATDYLLTVRRNVTEFIWRLEKLSDNSTQEQTTSNGGASGGTGLWDIGATSSVTADGKISNMVLITSNADSDVETVELYLRQQYRGVGTSTSTSTVTTQNYSLIAPEVIPLKRNAATISSIDLKFVDDTGTAIQPTKGLIELSMKLP